LGNPFARRHSADRTPACTSAGGGGAWSSTVKLAARISSPQAVWIASNFSSSTSRRETTSV
jgi:hypothetical protein